MRKAHGNGMETSNTFILERLVKSTLFRQGRPISHWLVLKGALRKL